MQRGNHISYWGIEEVGTVLPQSPGFQVPTTPAGSRNVVRQHSYHQQPLRYISSNSTPTNYTNSVSSFISHRHDDMSYTSFEDDSDIYGDAVGDHDDFFVQYKEVKVEEFRMLKETRALLRAGPRSRQRLVEQFEYVIITSELIAIEDGLKLHRLLDNDGVKVPNAMSPTANCQHNSLKVVLILISLIRHQIKFGVDVSIMKLTNCLARLFYKLTNTNDAHDIMIHKLTDYLQLNYRLNNNLIRFARALETRHEWEQIANSMGHQRENVNLSTKFSLDSGIKSLMVHYNQAIRHFIPLINLTNLYKFLNVYQLTDDSKDVDFIHIFNNDLMSDQILQKPFQYHLKQFIILRKFYLCCLLAIFENDGDQDVSLIDQEMLRSNLQAKFNFEFKSVTLTFMQKIKIVIDAFKTFNALTLKVVNFKVPQNNATFFKPNSDPENFYMDKLISRMEKIITNLRLLRQLQITEHDRQISQDLSNLSILYDQVDNQMHATAVTAKRRISSNPVELKKYSIQRHRSTHSNTGLNINLLNAVFEDTSEEIIQSTVIHHADQDNYQDPDDLTDEKVMSKDELQSALNSKFDKIFV